MQVVDLLTMGRGCIVTQLPLTIAILLTTAVCTVAYAMQTKWWYITSDAETQMWLLIELGSELVVAALSYPFARYVIKMANQRANRTAEAARLP